MWRLCNIQSRTGNINHRPIVEIRRMVFFVRGSMSVARRLLLCLAAGIFCFVLLGHAIHKLLNYTRFIVLSGVFSPSLYHSCRLVMFIFFFVSVSCMNCWQTVRYRTKIECNTSEEINMDKQMAWNCFRPSRSLCCCYIGSIPRSDMYLYLFVQQRYCFDCCRTSKSEIVSTAIY